MPYNYRKLLGKIIECCGSQAKFAEAMGVSEHSVSKKLNGSLQWKQSEIAKAIEVLGIAPGEISDYFFTLKVQ